MNPTKKTKSYFFNFSPPTTKARRRPLRKKSCQQLKRIVSWDNGETTKLKAVV